MDHFDRIRIFQKGWNFGQDGPGNRLLYHFQGCNMKCPWCSNPEGIMKRGTLMVNKTRLLDAVCPYGAISNQALNRELCRHCQTKDCLNKNRNEGIRYSSITYSVDDLFEEICRSRHLFYSGGGVTFTGGEPTLQFNALRKLLERIKVESINAAIETNGTSSRLPELFRYLDTLIIDLKHWSSKTHTKVLGADNQIILENLEKASDARVRTWLRIPLIPGFNDSYKDIIHFVHIVRSLNHGGFFLEILPYHEYGKVKWEQSGMDYKMGSKKLAPEIVSKAEEIFKMDQINVITNGRGLL